MNRILTPEEIFLELDGSCKMAIDRKFSITATTFDYDGYKNKMIQIISDGLISIQILHFSCKAIIK